MKTLVFIAIVIGIISGSCGVRKSTVTHDFPAEMNASVKTEFVKEWDKGKVLYDINCAKCHNTVVKRREIIPEFSQDKLIGYELRVKNAQHENNLPDERVTAEELGLIMTFLTYKKKNGVVPK